MNERLPKKDLFKYDEDGLTDRERAIIDRYLIHRNKHRAVREVCGMPKKKPGQKKPTRPDITIFSRPQVRMVLDREIADYRRRYKLEADWVMEQLAFLVRMDPRKLFDENGAPIAVQDLDEATAAAVVGIEVEDIYEGRGEDRVYVGQVRKYKLHSKTEAIALAMKHLGILDTGGSRQKDRLHEVIAAMREGPVDRKTIEGQGEIK